MVSKIMTKGKTKSAAQELKYKCPRSWGPIDKFYCEFAAHSCEAIIVQYLQALKEHKAVYAFSKSQRRKGMI